jgi:hypothetical protein
MTSNIVAVTIQYLRLKREWEESEIAPIRGWATSPEIGPASQTREVNCSDRPRDKRYGVPYPSSLAFISL